MVNKVRIKCISGRLPQTIFKLIIFIILFVVFGYGSLTFVPDFNLDTASLSPIHVSSLSGSLPVKEHLFRSSQPFELNDDGLVCHNKDSEARISMRGPYWVLYNYFKAERSFNCNESITYTTHGETEYLLDNLEVLIGRWRGPVSVSIFAPFDDYLRAVNTIVFLRQCPQLNRGENLVKDFATFHLFFNPDHFPTVKRIFSQADLRAMKADCSQPPPRPANESSKTERNLKYPINVARNVARETATTHFIFPSDIELYPSPGLIPDFLAMIRRNDPEIRNQNQPRVFVNSIFEIEADAKMPETKAELVRLLNNRTAVPFHYKICPNCHSIPGAEKWKSDTYNGTMRTFHIAKRTGKQRNWEPIFIGTNRDPFYDERLSWEGRADKMTQGFLLCVLNYDFHVLNGAFLIHKPGIKSQKDNKGRSRKNSKIISLQNNLINARIMPQLKKLYGGRNGCVR